MITGQLTAPLRVYVALLWRHGWVHDRDEESLITYTRYWGLSLPERVNE